MSASHAAPPRHLVRRSMITGAANDLSYVENAWQAGADAVMLDLEDGVPPSAKEHARSLLRSSIPQAGRGGSDVLVRINGDETLGEDLDAVAHTGVDTLVIPKVERPEQLADIDDRLTALEHQRDLSPGAIHLAVTIESVVGYAALDEILAASGRTVSVTLGTEDFAHDIGAEPTATGDEVLLPQLQIVLSSRLGGVTPLFGVLGALAGVADLAAVEQRAMWARSVGFRGSACSARTHVHIANRAFSPSEQAVERANRIIAAYAESIGRGDGRIEVDGGVVDAPVVLRAERLLEWADAVAALEARKAAHPQRSSV